MSLKEEIENAISAGISAREQEPKAQEDFYEEWLIAREPILEKFREAAGIFAACFGRESVAKFDKGSLYLSVDRDGQRYRMTFAANKESKEIECSFDFPEGKPLSRPLNGLTDTVLNKIITNFAYDVAWAKPARQRLPYGRIGPQKP